MPLTWTATASADPSDTGFSKPKRVVVSDGRVIEQPVADDQDTPTTPPEQRSVTICGGTGAIHPQRRSAQAYATVTCSKRSVASGTLRIQEFIRQDKEWMTIGADHVKGDTTPTPFVAFAACSTGFLIRATLDWVAVTPEGSTGPKHDSTPTRACE
jgi:hypothetical protein